MPVRQLIEAGQRKPRVTFPTEVLTTGKDELLSDAPVNAEALYRDISYELREKFHLNLSLQNNHKYVHGIRNLADYIVSQEAVGAYTIELTREGPRSLRIAVKMDGGTEFGHTIHVDGLAYPLKKDRTVVRNGGNENIKEFSERHTLSDGTSVTISLSKIKVRDSLLWWVHVSTQDERGETADFALNSIPSARAKQIIMRARLMKGKLSGIPAKQRKKVLQSFAVTHESLAPQTVVSRLLEDDGFDYKADTLASVPPWTIRVTSSHGEFKVDPHTGRVIERERYDENDPDGEFIDQVEKFDTVEWTKKYQKNDPHDSIDILDLGFWLKNGYYEEPEHDWRTSSPNGGGAGPNPQ